MRAKVEGEYLWILSEPQVRTIYTESSCEENLVQVRFIDLHRVKLNMQIRLLAISFDVLSNTKDKLTSKKKREMSQLEEEEEKKTA